MAGSKHTTIQVLERQNSEAGPQLHSAILPPFPKWPRILAVALNVFVLLASVSIMGILAHSLHNYSGTRDIHFGGTANSWPADLDLRPAYLTLAASATSVIPSLLATALGLRRLKVSSCSALEKMLSAVSAILFLLWITADAMQGVSEMKPKTDLLSWACRRRESPTNVLVNYTSICDEQRAVKYLSILITMAEAATVISFYVTWSLTKRWARLVDEPWRIKA